MMLFSLLAGFKLLTRSPASSRLKLEYSINNSHAFSLYITDITENKNVLVMSLTFSILMMMLLQLQVYCQHHAG